MEEMIDVRGRIILGWMLKEYDMRKLTGSSDHGNYLPCNANGRNFSTNLVTINFSRGISCSLGLFKN
jgi:hypothetical protein